MAPCPTLGAEQGAGLERPGNAQAQPYGVQRRGILMKNAMDGGASMTVAPLVEPRRAKTIRLIQEEMNVPHAMRLQRRCFRETPEWRARLRAACWRGVLLLSPRETRETREIAFVADNRGEWLLRRHVLEQQPPGAKTWLRVA